MWDYETWRTIGTWIGAALATFGAAQIAFRRMRNKLSHRLDNATIADTAKVDRLLFLMEGRPAVVLPEDPDVVLAPALLPALDRIYLVERYMDQHRANDEAVIDLLTNLRGAFDEMSDSLSDHLIVSEKITAETLQRIDKLEGKDL